MNLSLSFSFTSNRFYFYDDRKNLTWAKLLFAVSKDNGEERERERKRAQPTLFSLSHLKSSHIFEFFRNRFKLIYILKKNLLLFCVCVLFDHI